MLSSIGEFGIKTFVEKSIYSLSMHEISAIFFVATNGACKSRPTHELADLLPFCQNFFSAESRCAKKVQSYVHK